ncbi:MAG: O-acetyl-ADP-ribose deacetylase, partial [Clostridia bacterium]|nr:O-acetyl-ADP-ribose deacetylase [Clostridia bacterium]
MPLQLIRDDITRVRCDAVVNAANNSLLGGGGVDGAIHRAAGPELLAECRTLGGCDTGDAKITRGYKLPAKYVIHTVGPVWYGGKNGEEELLRSCYRRSLALAKEYNCESVAFPLISAGVYGYPKDKAISVAEDEITSFLSDNDMLVDIVIFDKSAFRISEKLYGDIAAFIDDKYVSEHEMTDSRRVPEMLSEKIQNPCFRKGAGRSPRPCADLAAAAESLDEALSSLDESFSEMLLRKIDEKG